MEKEKTEDQIINNTENCSKEEAKEDFPENVEKKLSKIKLLRKK